MAESKLNSMGLALNHKKIKQVRSSEILSRSQTINFLGYEHYIDANGSAKTRISKNRIRKIKTRIALAFLDYAKTTIPNYYA